MKFLKNVKILENVQHLGNYSKYSKKFEQKKAD